jgi:hypothetical protein
MKRDRAAAAGQIVPQIDRCAWVAEVKAPAEVDHCAAPGLLGAM